jgi:hypothetical protein
VDLTPPKGTGVWLAGYGFQRRMERVRDPICARCLYVDDGATRFALVVADVIGLLLPSVERVRRLVGNGIEVVVASTHNHQSPDTMGYWGEAILYMFPHTSGVDPGYMRVLEKRLALAVKRAADAAEPASLWFGTGTIPEGVVRNLRTEDVYDRSIRVIEARAGDRVLATHVNLGCHPETLGDRSKLLSADFPGLLRSEIEAARGGTAVFTNGSLGGMITADLDRETSYWERVEFLGEMGRKLGAAALEAIASAERADVQRIRVAKAEVELLTDNDLFVTLERIGLVEPHRRGENGGFLTEVGRVDFGPASFALVPGEPTPKVGLRIAEMLASKGVRHPTVIALANDELGYILDPAEFDDPEFSYEVTVSVGRDTAPTIERALASL